VARLVDNRWIKVGPESGLPDPMVSCLLVDARGRLWAATHEAGLFCRRGSRFEPVTDPAGRKAIRNITSLIENPPGTVWAGTEHGLRRLEGGQVVGRWDRHPSGRELDVITLSPRSAGGIWVGTAHGLAVVGSGGRLEDCPGQPFSLEGVTVVFEDGRSATWIGLQSGELWRLRQSRFRRVPLPPEMIQGNIWAIVPDLEGHLWFHTDDGILRVPRHELESLADGRNRDLPYQKFGLADGLNSLQVPQPGFPSAIRLRDGRLAFATSAGLSLALPGQRTYPLPDLRTYVDRFRVNDDEHPVAERVVLPPGPKKVEIGFVAPNFRNPAAVGYRYRLLGIEEGWTTAGAGRHAAYANLPHGAYTFEVQSFRGTGGQISEVTRFRFRINPHVWETSWFRVLAGISLVVFAFYAYRLRVARLQRQKHLLEEQVVQRTRELKRSNAELEAAKGDLEAANRELERLAAYDALTGLANRRCFDEHLAAEWRRAARFRYPVSLLMADVDLFKRFNDSFGHPAGDECLRRLGRLLLARTWRTGDLPARFGGEEFVVFLAASDSTGASAIAEEIRSGLAALAIPHVPDKSPPVATVSIGVATIQDVSRSSPAELLKQADEALYGAKQAGRNRVNVFRAPGPDGAPPGA
jgi:diguanylate cyclase (GGDEF)-like protein